MKSITDVAIALPTTSEILDTLLLLGGYNQAIVITGTTCLGIAAGLVGNFSLLRKRSLVGDALAHCALPGLAAMYLLLVLNGYPGKNLPMLLLGATCSGIIGVLAIQLITQLTRIKEDAAIGAVLSTFFGIGVVLLSAIQSLGSGSEGGLQHFIYGQTAAMRESDAKILLLAAIFSLAIILLFLKEFRLICFDREFANVQGWPTTKIDLLMMSLVVLVTVVGIQSVGLILIVAMLIVPPAAARFWTESLKIMLPISAIIGGISGYLGSSISSLLPRLPAGAVIVLTAGVIFFLSFFFAPKRGVLIWAIKHFNHRMKITTDHILRHSYEILEQRKKKPETSNSILNAATFLSLPFITLIFRRLINLHGMCAFSLSESGMTRAQNLTRNHRLWEEYLVKFGGIETSHVDYSADLVEHILSKKIVQELEETLRSKDLLPESIHPLTFATAQKTHVEKNQE